jgi:hydroxymethylglutaryl-CoA reductase
MSTSRFPGFYKEPLATRLGRIAETGLLGPESTAHLAHGGGLAVEVADRMSENVIATHGLPLGVALSFRVNGTDRLVPMAVEEPSVIAAASNAARIVRLSGGFQGEATRPEMTAQIQLDEVPNPDTACARLRAAARELCAAGDLAIPGMVERGGGCRDLEVRDLGEGLVVVHVYVDVGDAMGANLVDAVAEAMAGPIHRIAGGLMGLRILSNLPLRRRILVTANAGEEALGGAALADGIARASRFAERDPFRAVTHNKGVLNGVDAAAVALGQDWRAIEAGAHAFAALGGRYAPLATWTRTPGGLAGRLEMPLAAATVGGSTRVSPGVRAAFELLGPLANAGELAIVLGAAGLASNLAALRALAGEGIQRGHMRLHRRKEEAAAATPERIHHES